MRSALAVLLLAVVASLGFVAWKLLGSDPSTTTPVVVASGAAESALAVPAPAPATEDVRRLAVERREAEPLEPAPAPDARVPVPESYRKALSGLRGRLVEEDGKPVPGMKVELLELAAGGVLGDVAAAFGPTPIVFPEIVLGHDVSDADGVFRLDGALALAFHAVGIDLGGARGTLRFVDRMLASGAVTDLGVIVLAPFVKWTGKVVDEDGAPVPGARVRATLLPPIVFQPGVADVGRATAVIPQLQRASMRFVIEIPDSVRALESRLPFPTTLARDDGTFELAGVPQGLASLVVDHAGFTGGFKGPNATGKRDRDLGEVMLSRGMTVSGRVVDGSGHPVAGAEVVGGAIVPMADLAIAFPAASDAEGRFAVEHLSDNASEFVFAARRAPVDGWVFSERVDGSKPVTIVLPAASSLDVTLTAAGTVVPDAKLWLRNWIDAPMLTMAPLRELPSEQVSKVEDGRLRVSGVTAGRYELYGRAPGFAPASMRIDVGGDPAEPTAVMLEFFAARELSVLVIAQDTIQPVEHAQVSVSGDQRVSPPLLSIRSDALGVARLVDLPARTVWIRAYHPAYASTVRKVDLAELAGDAAEPARIELALGPGAAVKGFVHHGGRPLLEPMLFVIHKSGQGEHRALEDQVPRSAGPGLDGTFTLAGLHPGQYRWELMPRLFAGDPQDAIRGIVESSRETGSSRRGNVELEVGKTAELSIDLDPSAADKPGRVAGIIRSSEPEAQFVVRVHASGPGFANEQRERSFDVASNRRFTLEPVGPGHVNLWVSRKAAAGQEYATSTLHQDFFEIGAGEERRLELDFEFTNAEVQVVDGTGAPVARASVSFSIEQQSTWAATDEKGLVRLELPRPGRWVVLCNDSKVGRGRIECEFPARETATLVIDRGV